MHQSGSWGDDLAVKLFGSDDTGLESLDMTDPTQLLSQNRNTTPWFKSINITNEQGAYYVSLYLCELGDRTVAVQRLATWLASLKSSDRIKLSVSSMYTNIPFSSIVTIMSAFANTKAKIDIILDQIVMDGLGYFYLLADRVTKRECGALLIPSYIGGRREDTSLPWKAVHDFYEWLVADGVALGRLTQEEADLLNDGKTVIIPDDRQFNKV